VGNETPASSLGSPKNHKERVSMFNGITDAIKVAVARVAAPVLQTYLQENYVQRYGTLKNLDIDPSAKEISLTVRPKGEDEDIRINFEYKIISQSDSYAIEIRKVETSREWLTLLAQDYVVKQRLDVPSAAVALL
jgi:type II secretory pathway component PulC